MATQQKIDPRVYVVLGIREEHGFAMAASKDSSSGEAWRCRCGASYNGEGAINKGHHHQAVALLAALDAVTAVA